VVFEGFLYRDGALDAAPRAANNLAFRGAGFKYWVEVRARVIPEKLVA
jgi:hypothetical protein